MRSGLWTFALVASWVLGGGALVAQEGFNPIAPSEEELTKMLAAEPFGEATWPVWRQRYLDWNDNRTKRSREFTDGLTKVATFGQLFENTAHHNIRSLLVEGKAFENVYEALRTLNEKDFPEEERTKLQKRLDEERPSQFATHPTFRQRMAAIEEFPDQAPAENAPALSLVDDVEGLEKALTEYLTGFHSMILQAIAQQNAG